MKINITVSFEIEEALKLENEAKEKNIKIPELIRQIIKER